MDPLNVARIGVIKTMGQDEWGDYFDRIAEGDLTSHASHNVVFLMRLTGCFTEKMSFSCVSSLGTVGSMFSGGQVSWDQSDHGHGHVPSAQSWGGVWLSLATVIDIAQFQWSRVSISSHEMSLPLNLPPHELIYLHPHHRKSLLFMNSIILPTAISTLFKVTIHDSELHWNQTQLKLAPLDQRSSIRGSYHLRASIHELTFDPTLNTAVAQRSVSSTTSCKILYLRFALQSHHDPLKEWEFNFLVSVSVCQCVCVCISAFDPAC